MAVDVEGDLNARMPELITDVFRALALRELQKASFVMRAQSYRRRMFAEFDRVKELLLP